MTHNPKTFFEAYWTPARLRSLPRVAERCPSAACWHTAAGRSGPWSDLILVPPGPVTRHTYTTLVGCRLHIPDTVLAFLADSGEYCPHGPQPDLGIEAPVYLDVLAPWGMIRIRPRSENQYLTLHSEPYTGQCQWPEEDPRAEIGPAHPPRDPNYRRYIVKLEPEPSPDNSRDPDWDRPQPVVPEARGEYRNGVWHSDYGPRGAD